MKTFASFLSPLVLLFIFNLTLTSCGNSDRYEITKDEEGRTLRLDKKTGEIAIISGDRVVIPKTQADIDAEKREQEEKAREPKYWVPISLPSVGADKISLSTSWQNGHMYYKFRVEPVPPGWAKYSSHKKAPFDLVFYDKGGFKIIEFEIPKNLFVRIVDDSGVPTGLSINSTMPCDLKEYAQLEDWSVEYRLKNLE